MGNQKKIRRLYYGVLILALVIACIDPYSPNIKSTDSNILVVDGFLDASTGSAIIQLTRTSSIFDAASPPNELNASVSIVASNGFVYQLFEQGRGKYSVSGISVNPQMKYSLKITTKDGEQYSSSEEVVKITPPIDSVSWTLDRFNDGVVINVSTQDPQNNTRYYQWDFIETWEYQTKYFSTLEYMGNEIVQRTNSISRCYSSLNNQSIIVGSSTKLSQDVISNFKVAFVPLVSTKLSRRYSILVKQYALTKDAYEYWSILKKNSDGLGSLYAPIPSQLNGNIKNLTNPSSAVIGYFSAYSVEQKRIFVKNSQLPISSIQQTGYENCTSTSIKLEDLPLSPSYLFLNPIYPPGSPFLTGYEVATPECADCRYRGGSTTVPDFWN